MLENIEITFIFKTDINPSVQYGKLLLDFLSSNHYGVDNEVKPYIYNAINSYLMNNSLPLLKTVEFGILGISTEWCSFDEQKMNMFQLYIDCNDKNTYYYNGESGPIIFTYNF
jgi:hypothetical protein